MKYLLEDYTNKTKQIGTDFPYETLDTLWNGNNQVY